MNAKQILIFIGCVIGTLSFVRGQNANLNPRQEALQRAYESPIDFWGEVVDQDGNPVEGAKATFTIDSHMGEDDDKPKVTVLSDAGGMFSLTGKKGAGLVVYVAKEGYYSTEEQSAAAMNYFLKSTNNLNSFPRRGKNEPFPTEAQPTVFVLTQKGPMAANLGRKQLRVPVPKDGAPINVDLARGRVVASGQGDLQIQSWVADNGADVVHPFAWKCRVTVLGGGLQVRAGKLAFQAPPDGYQPQDEVDMAATASPWIKDMKKEYFLELSGNRYVRMRFWMVCGGGNFLNLDYYLNTQSGDRNLESEKSPPY